MPVSDTHAMIAGMDPVLEPGTYLFRMAETDRVPPDALASFREPEGLSLIVPADEPQPGEAVMRLIRLSILSDLEGVGLIAAVSNRLAAHGIACNVVAALHHDYLLVPASRADEAIAQLRALQVEARESAT